MHIATKHERNIIFLPVEEVLSTEFAMSAEKTSSNRARKKTNRIIFETVDVLKESPVFLFAFLPSITVS